ncbi:uncharacterized protein LOC135343261 [Halichondria panicea]|uniref:uncharacterized protein LOC135343261 n=1 Tax=Halichondria panicea TaxID=6063 RepID=UPI00312BA79B
MMRYLSTKLLCLTIFIELCCSSDLDANVIIIGAGMAGISAAQRLQEGGINDILILEGSDKVGGRVASVEFGGVTVSLGATWIQGIDPAHPELHPTYQIAQRCGGLRGLYQNYTSLITYDSYGKQNQQPMRWKEFREALSKTEKTGKDLLPEDKCCEKNVRDELNASGWTPVTPVDKWVDWFSIDYFQGCTSENLSLCLLPTDLTDSRFISDGGEETDYFVTDPNGYVKIMKCMADEIEGKKQTRMVFNAVVTKIDWSRDDYVCVTATVSGQANQFCSKHAISTVSVGVLKSGSIQFIPELPKWKGEVIQRFKLGTYIHIMLEFSEVFWTKHEQIGYIDTKRAYYPLFLNLREIFPERPKVLIAELTGENAKRAVYQDKAVTIAEIEAILRKMYPTSNVTVVNSMISDWIDNPMIRGSFLYLSVEQNYNDYWLLAAQVGNLYFSGEATSADFPGYVHGAHFAGIRTAETIMRLN